MIEQNVGGLDRKLRAGGAVVALIGAVLLATQGATTIAFVAGVVGVGLGFNAVTGICLGNKLLGINTCEWEPAG